MIVPHASTPDGSLIVRQAQDLATLTSNRQPPLQVLVRNAANAALSPDGRWIAYEAEISKQREVIVRPFPEVERGSWQISRDGGSHPVWSRRGNELFYLSRAGMMSVTLRPEGSYPFDAPRHLFKVQGMYSGLGRHYGVGPKDTFVFLKRLEGTKPPVIRLVLNFADDVAARVKPK